MQRIIGTATVFLPTTSFTVHRPPMPPDPSTPSFYFRRPPRPPTQSNSANQSKPSMPKPPPPLAKPHRQVVVEHIKAGLRPPSFQGLEHDKEVFLLVANHSPQKLKRQLFYHASMLLRGKPDFMREVVTIDPSLFICGTNDCQQDLYLILFVFSISPQTVHDYILDLNNPNAIPRRGIIGSGGVRLHCRRQKEFVGWLYEKLGAMMEVYDGPIREIIDRSILNQGDDTSDHFQGLILGYLWGWEFPSVLFHRQARKAYQNLKIEFTPKCYLTLPYGEKHSKCPLTLPGGDKSSKCPLTVPYGDE